MTASEIWTKDGGGWSLSRPKRFPDEATLHGLIEKNPKMLPLSGAPLLVILGREVPLGSGYADLVGVETTGRPAIIEVKLAKNNEARRAVVAQILAYAAHLHGTTREQLEDRVKSSLQKQGNRSLVEAASTIQEDAFDADEFTQALEEHLQEGRFRLVFVLDEVPEELMTLVAYLEHVTDKLVIDLVAVSSFDVAGTSVVVPQRVTPERHEVMVEDRGKESGTLYQGHERFEASIGQADQQEQEPLSRLLQWTRHLESDGLASLATYEGIGAKRFTLLPRLKHENVGLVTIWNDGGAYLQFWQSVFERNAPSFIDRIEKLLEIEIGQGNTTRKISDELLDILTEAYVAAAK
jgi:uncharacterized tellurite resistance protein B-like protein